MKNQKSIIVSCIIVLFVFQFTFSQTYIDNETSTKEVQTGQRLTPTVQANLGINTAPNPMSTVIQNNAVFIRQIGDYNTSNIKVATNASEINLLQNGNSNDTQLNYVANTAIADLVQNGNNNKIVDFVNSPFEDISLDLIQEGNYLKFERDGVNELTKSLKFRQAEASPTIIVRSFY